jgi:hypothetical protein
LKTAAEAFTTADGVAFTCRTNSWAEGASPTEDPRPHAVPSRASTLAVTK